MADQNKAKIFGEKSISKKIVEDNEFLEECKRIIFGEFSQKEFSAQSNSTVMNIT